MENKNYEIESKKPFSESLIWQLNREYYQNEGIEAWRQGTVPHNLSSNAIVGKTYAELIFGFLRDLATKGQKHEKVYILELGAGHGRLAFHVLKQLERLIEVADLDLPPYCYVLSDIVEENLQFFYEHPQFQNYFEKGALDLAYFDAIGSTEIQLRYSGLKIAPQSLDQPLLVIANYFFDSIPNDLYFLNNKTVAACSVSLHSKEDPGGMDRSALLENIGTEFQNKREESPFYSEDIFNEMMEDYRQGLANTYLFFPHKGMKCIQKLQQLSKKGLMVLSLDKGYHQLEELENVKSPELITHGSFSIWVNFHALGAFCEKGGGTALFPSFPTFFLNLGCLFFIPEKEVYSETKLAYQRFVNEFGPDDFNGLKNFTYKHIARMTIKELIKMLRISFFDSSMFVNVLPRIKQLTHQVTAKERNSLAQLMHETWDMYFTINEDFDLAYEIGGVFYDLGYHKEALTYFDSSVALYGHKADIYYNSALCYYQLREDKKFLQTLAAGRTAFPGFERFNQLDKLDLGAA